MVMAVVEDKLTCANFGLCGGCTYLDMPYPEQLLRKENSLRTLLKHLTVNISPIIPSPKISYYRNKMEFAFGFSSHSQLILGLRIKKQFSRIVNVENCLLQSAESNNYLARLRFFFNCRDQAGLVPTTALLPYNLFRHTGQLRYAVIREGKNTGERMFVLVTAALTAEEEAEIKKIAGEFPEVTTFVWAVNSRKGDSAVGEKVSVLTGLGYIQEKLHHLTFRISPYSFFQTNTLGAEKLYQIIQRQAGTGKLLFDVYCGGGGIALSLAGQFEKVIGIENSASSISDAKINAQLNKINNCEFICGDAEQGLKSLAANHQPEVLVVDPPRAGLLGKVIKNILILEPARIIYVSCNPQALAADLEKLQEKYQVQAVQPVDLFPHTPHLETVVTLGLSRRLDKN
ncbi:MAG: 23S rRNA (uracil(1939)-C(5))-methyltransferase RlmD [Elusimicrobiota bacterium]